jgi:hypothetical protein
MRLPRLLWLSLANWCCNAIASRTRCCIPNLSKIDSKPDGAACAGEAALVVTFRRGCVERCINPIVAARFLLIPNLSQDDINPERRVDENVDGDQLSGLARQ